MNLRFIVRMLSVALLGIASASAQIDEKNWGKNTAGVSLAAHEEPRQKTPQGTIIWYNLIGKEFPDNVPLVLWQWIPGQPPKPAMDGVSFDKRGVLVCSGKPGFCEGDGPDDPINLKTTAILGEPKRFGVASSDGSIAAFVDAVPFPIEATAKDCKLSVVRMSPLAETVVATGSGFVPNETLTVTTQWSDAGATTKNQAGPDGHWTGVVIGDPKAQPKGKAHVSVTGKSCSVSVSFDWGVGSNHPL